MRDGQTLTAQANRAIDIIDGRKPAKKARFVTTSGQHATLDHASLQRARELVGLKGYVSNIPTGVMPAAKAINSYHDLWHVEQSFRMSERPRGPADLPSHPRRDRSPPHHRFRRPRNRPRPPRTLQGQFEEDHPNATPTTARHHPHRQPTTQSRTPSPQPSNGTAPVTWALKVRNSGLGSRGRPAQPGAAWIRRHPLWVGLLRFVEEDL